VTEEITAELKKRGVRSQEPESRRKRTKRTKRIITIYWLLTPIS